jgi:type II secretory ATPase GspE/PulE/Tfp pilus assembly ATPase PilB-like protein
MGFPFLSRFVRPRVVVAAPSIEIDQSLRLDEDEDVGYAEPADYAVSMSPVQALTLEKEMFASDAAPVVLPDEGDEPVGLQEVFEPVGKVVKQVERHRFAEYMVRNGLVSRQFMDIALKEQRITAERIGTILMRNTFIRKEDLIDAILAFQPEMIATEEVASCRIPVEILERMSIIVSAETSTTIYVGSQSEEDDVRDVFQQYYPDKIFHPVTFIPDKMDDYIDKMKRSRTIAPDDDEVLSDHERLDRILHRALHMGASDIHIEPRGRTFSVFFRLLGVRHHVHEGSIDEYNVVMTQIKDRAKMDIAERRLDQDGSFQIEYSGKFIDLRVVTIPSIEGEGSVIRVLDSGRIEGKLDKLGITRVSQWRRGTSLSSGICLICGPTGSGKSTTLMATLKERDRISEKIYTIEDPVENRIPLVTQVATNSGVDLTFSRALKSFMRGDPDVIVLGEVRDEETARNAIKAAETGHLVLATLHTRSITGAVARLRDIGIRPYELRDILKAVMVQNLIRCTCTTCKGIGFVADHECPSCKGTGYDRRTIVSETASFLTGKEIEQLMSLVGDREGERGVEPWPLLIDDAIGKMVAGQTTMNELRRVFGEEADERVQSKGIDGRLYEIAPPEPRL